MAARKDIICQISGPEMTLAAKGLLGADDLEIVVDEDMVRPVDADVAEPQRQLSLRGTDRGDGMSRGRS